MAWYKKHESWHNALCYGSALRPGASGQPNYCAPLVCVPDVIGWLSVWRHYKPKTKPVDLHVDPKHMPWCACACETLNDSWQRLVLCQVHAPAIWSWNTAPMSLSLYFHCTVPPLSTQYNGHVTRPHVEVQSRRYVSEWVWVSVQLLLRCYGAWVGHPSMQQARWFCNCTLLRSPTFLQQFQSSHQWTSISVITISVITLIDLVEKTEVQRQAGSACVLDSST